MGPSLVFNISLSKLIIQLLSEAHDAQEKYSIFSSFTHISLVNAVTILG